MNTMYKCVIQGFFCLFVLLLRPVGVTRVPVNAFSGKIHRDLVVDPYVLMENWWVEELHAAYDIAQWYLLPILSQGNDKDYRTQSSASLIQWVSDKLRLRF